MKSFNIVTAIAIFFFGIISLPWLLLFIGIMVAPNPSRPEVKYAEFSFKLKYKINGELNVIEDVYVAKYNGIGMDEGSGKYRKWKGHIKGSRVKNVLLLETNTDKVYYTINFPEYYMGDDSKPIYPNFEPFYSVHRIGPSKFNPAKLDNRIGPSKFSVVQLDELLEDYGIELISWEMKEPVVNNFIKRFLLWL
jgi:hypothetical protein